MTKEEKDYCEICAIHDSCGYVSRGLQDKCEKMQIFADGMQAGIDKATLWLCNNATIPDDVYVQFDEAMNE